MREQVSLLLDHGHSQARKYPVGMVWDEARIVISRINKEEAGRMTLLQLAAASILSKKGAALFKKTVKGLING